jgi:hypothetical protein
LGEVYISPVASAFNGEQKQHAKTAMLLARNIQAASHAPLAQAFEKQEQLASQQLLR